jgi:hypothetical protein
MTDDLDTPPPHIAKIDTRHNKQRAGGVHEFQWVCVTCGATGDWVLNQKVAARGGEKHIHQGDT